MKIVIEGTMPTLNEFIEANRKGWYLGNKMKQDNQRTAMDCITFLARNKQIFTDKVFIKYTFYEPNRRRDKSNVASFAIKVIEDALVQCHIIPDDGWKYLEGYSVEFHVSKEHPRIEVEINGY